MPRKTKQNTITSPEILTQVSQENLRLKNDYIAYLESIGRSKTTIHSYINDLDIFFVWNLLHNENKFFISLTKRDIIGFQNWLLNENKNSPARIRRLKSVLSSLSNYIENILDDDFKGYRSIIRKVESPASAPVRDKTVLTDEQLELLLSALVEKRKYQQACAVAMAAFSGARKSELVRLKVDYFKDENIIYGSLYKTPEKIKTKGRGNGKFIYKYVIAGKVKPYLDLWLEQRGELGVSGEWLYMTKTKGIWAQTKPETLNSWALTISKILGVPFYWHCLRHFFTTMLSRLGLPDGVIQEVIGWDSADMVKIYKDISTDEELGKYFDENGVKENKQVGLGDI